MAIRNAKPDAFNRKAPSTVLQGTNYAMQDGVLFDTLTGSRVRSTACIGRTDGLHLIVGNLGFTRGGKYLGTVDAENVLTPGKPGRTPKAPEPTEDTPAEAPAKPARGRKAKAPQGVEVTGDADVSDLDDNAGALDD